MMMIHKANHQTYGWFRKIGVPLFFIPVGFSIVNHPFGVPPFMEPPDLVSQAALDAAAPGFPAGWLQMRFET